MKIIFLFSCENYFTLSIIKNITEYLLCMYCRQISFQIHIFFSKLLCQQMHSSLKHKMLQRTLKISLYMGSYKFRSVRTIIREHMPDLAKVPVFVEIISKNTTLKLLLCSGNMCFCNQKTITLSGNNP
jgi:hypothetical protein